MPVYVFYGDEAFLRERELQTLRERVVSPAMAALSYKKLSAPAACEVQESVAATSLALGGDTLIEIRNFGCLAKKAAEHEVPALDQLKFSLENIAPTKHVVFVSAKIDRKIKFPKWLAAQKTFQVREFKSFKPWETDKAADALTAYAMNEHIAIERAAALRLAETIGTEMQSLMNEVKKLSIYAQGRTVSVADVALLSDHNENTFQMLDDWIKGEHRSRVFKTLNELLLRQHPIRLYGLTQTYLNGLFQMFYLKQQGLSPDDIAKNLKKHPFKVKMDLRTFGQVPFARLEKLKAMALEMEWKSKTGQLDARLSYELLMGS